MFRSSTQHKGMCMVPKRAVDVMSCQIVRLLQLTQSAIVPIGYHVQRKVREIQLEHRSKLRCFDLASFPGCHSLIPRLPQPHSQAATVFIPRLPQCSFPGCRSVHTGSDKHCRGLGMRLGSSHFWATVGLRFQDFVTQVTLLG